MKRLGLINRPVARYLEMVRPSSQVLSKGRTVKWSRSIWFPPWIGGGSRSLGTSAGCRSTGALSFLSWVSLRSGDSLWFLTGWPHQLIELLLNLPGDSALVADDPGVIDDCLSMTQHSCASLLSAPSSARYYWRRWDGFLPLARSRSQSLAKSPLDRLRRFTPRLGLAWKEAHSPVR